MKRFDRFHFATRLETALSEKGYSVKDAADYLDITAQAVYGWLDGTRVPKLDNLIPLADLLGISLDELLPSYEAEWDGATLNGRAIEQRRLEERNVNRTETQITER